MLYEWGAHAMPMLTVHPELVGMIGDALVKYLPGEGQNLATARRTRSGQSN